MNNVYISDQLTITSSAASSDGGTLVMTGHDSQLNKFDFLLPQHRISGNFRPGWIPGRLHVNGMPVDVRSALETAIIDKFKEAKVQWVSPFPEDNTSKSSPISDEQLNASLSDVINHFISFICSEEYIKIDTTHRK